MTTVREQLDYLRGEIQAERISMGEMIDLQGLADDLDAINMDDGWDIELLEWAGVPEDEARERGWI